MKKDNNDYGVITEQGDLGLGFNPVSEAEAEKIQENKDKKESK